jgi:glycosyltransferase involved in cell wall biosynthesis
MTVGDTPGVASSTPIVSVIVPATRGAAPTLPQTLEALAAQTLDRDDFEVIVVDDGAPDGVRAVAEGSALRPRVVTRDAPGPGAARNKGASVARAQVLAFTDADCAPAPDWLAEGLRAIGELDLVQGAVLPAQNGRIGPWDRTLAVVSEYGLYETANLYVRRDWFERVGGFVDWLDDRNEPRPFGEDAVFAWSAKRAGARSGFAPEALVRHAVFDGRWPDTLRERARVGLFPALVQRIPELRDAFLYRRWFLSERTAAFDAAALAVVAAAARRSPWPLALAAPYVRVTIRDARRWRGADAVKSALVGAAGDVLGAAALVRGSAEQRTLVL